VTDTRADPQPGPASPDSTPDAASGGRDWAKIAVIGLGVVLFAGLLVAVLVPRSRPAVRSRVVSLDVSNQKLVHVTFEVEKAPLAEARCDVAFFDGDGLADGRLVGVVVPPRSDNGRVSTLTLDFRPIEPVARAAVSQCVITRTR
jgi:hypothetical protein